MRCGSSAVLHSLLVVDSSCGHNWCLCCRQMGQSWRMWWTVCSASLQSQSAESMMPIRFRCARRPQCPVRNLNIVVRSCSRYTILVWNSRFTPAGSSLYLSLQSLASKINDPLLSLHSQCVCVCVCACVSVCVSVRICIRV